MLFWQSEKEKKRAFAEWSLLPVPRPHLHSFPQPTILSQLSLINVVVSSCSGSTPPPVRGTGTAGLQSAADRRKLASAPPEPARARSARVDAEEGRGRAWKEEVEEEGATRNGRRGGREESPQRSRNLSWRIKATVAPKQAHTILPELTKQRPTCLSCARNVRKA